MRALAIPAVLSRIFWAKCVNGRAAGAADSLLLLNSKPGRPWSMLASTQGGPIQMDFARKYANSAHISNILSWDLINALQWLQLSFSGIYTRCSVWIINGPGNMSFLNSKSMTFITFYHFAEWIPKWMNFFCIRNGNFGHEFSEKLQKGGWGSFSIWKISLQI